MLFSIFARVTFEGEWKQLFIKGLNFVIYLHDLGWLHYNTNY